MALLLVSSKVTQSQLAMMICHLLLPFTVPLTAEEAVQCQNNLGQRQKKKYLGHRRNLSNQYDLLTFNP